MSRFIVYVDYEVEAETAEEAERLVMADPQSHEPSVSGVTKVED